MPNAPSLPGDFNAQARDYREGRPGYPPALIDHLIGVARLNPGEHIVELGAGSGQLTSTLSGRGYSITAVEPAGQMRNHAPQLSDTTFVDGYFEETGLQDGVADWIVSAQAFHWADRPRALPELHRILKADRYFTVLWNDRDSNRNPITGRAMQIVCEFWPGYSQPYRHPNWFAELESSDLFKRADFRENDHAVTISRQGFLAMWRSLNRIRTAIGYEKHEQLIAAIDAYLRHDNIETINVHYTCKAWTVQRV